MLIKCLFYLSDKESVITVHQTRGFLKLNLTFSEFCLKTHCLLFHSKYGCFTEKNLQFVNVIILTKCNCRSLSRRVLAGPCMVLLHFSCAGIWILAIHSSGKTFNNR